MNQALALDILCVTYFLTSITMSDSQNGDMRQIWHLASLASARMNKLSIPFQNNLLDGALCKNDFYFRIFSFVWFLNVILLYALILPVFQLQTQQVMTSQIRSHIEYLIQTDYILVLIC